MSETTIHDAATAAPLLADVARSVFARGLVGGAAGNMSVRVREGVVITPTGVSLGALEAGHLAVLDPEGRHVSGLKPSKEAPFHLNWYRANPDHTGIVHLHSPWAVALACLRDLDEADTLPPLTPYQIMKIGRMPLVPYADPGSAALTAGVARMAPGRKAVLLANHGPVCGGVTLQAALDTAEEVEATARLVFTLGQRPARLLDADAVERLMR